MTTRTKPVYEIQFAYTRHGAGVGIALYQEKVTYSTLFSTYETGESTIAFMAEGSTLLTADGKPHANLDGGYHADDWQSVKQLMYDDSPEDGTIEQMFDSEYPGLLSQVRKVLKEHRSQRLTPDGRVIKIPKRAAQDSDGAYLAKLVRAFNGLPLRGTDEVGHVVNVHKTPDDGSVRQALYDWTINYETRSWANEFQDWYEELIDSSRDPLPDVEVLSSYEIGVTQEY